MSLPKSKAPTYSPLVGKDNLVHDTGWLQWLDFVDQLIASPGLSGALLSVNNLSDVASVSASQTNLGLGTASNVSFASLTLSGLTASLPVVTDGAKKLVSVSYATFANSLGLGPLSFPTFAGLTIDNLTGILQANFGTVNVVSIGTSLVYAGFSLNTVQDIRVTATPTWVTVKLTGLTASRLVVSDASQKLASNAALTTNKLPKAVSSGASLADSSIFDDGTFVGIGTTAPKGFLSVHSLDTGTGFSFALWTQQYSIFGPNTHLTTGAAIGIGYSSTEDKGNIVCLAPNVAWKPLRLAAQTFELLSAGTTLGLSQDVSGMVGIGIAPDSTIRLFLESLTVASSGFGTGLYVRDPIRAVSVDETNYFTSLEISANAYNIATGKTDSGYRFGIEVAAAAYETNFKGTLNDQRGIRILHGILHSNASAVITNSYGLYIDSYTIDGTVTNLYSIYQANNNAINYFEGNIQLNKLTASKVVVTDGSKNLISGTNSDTEIASAVTLKHARQHALDSTADHTIGGLTSGYLVKSDGTKLAPATNTDTDVASAVSLKHTRLHDMIDPLDHSSTDGKPSHYLGGDLQWHELPQVITYYWADTADALGGLYKVMDTPLPGAASNSYTVTGADIEVQDWISPLAGVGFTTITAGSVIFHAHAQQTSGTASAFLYGKLYKRVGAVETLLGQSANSGLVTNVNTEMEVSFEISVTSLNLTDRLVVKLFMTRTGGGTDPHVTIFLGGANDSHLHLPAAVFDVSSTPTFAGLFLTNLTASKVVMSDASKELVSGTNTDAELASAVSLKHAAVTVSAPIALIGQALSLVNNDVSPGTITAIDVGVLANSDTVVPTSKAVKTAIAAGGGMVYPGAGIAVSTGAAWDSSLGLSTAIATPGVDTKVASEKAVRDLFGASNLFLLTTFTNADLTAGVLTVTHTLGNQYAEVEIVDNNGKIIIADEITFMSTTQFTVDLSSYGAIAGTWRVLATAPGGTVVTLPQALDVTDQPTFAGLTDTGLTASQTVETDGSKKLVSAPHGIWTTPGYSGGNFTASGAMTWTVEAGDVTNYEYTIIGKTMAVNFFIITSTIGGTPNLNLYIAIPASKTAAKEQRFVGMVFNNSIWNVARVQVTAGGSVIIISKDISESGNFVAENNLCYAIGSITFEIN